ncbi:MAG: sugar ABC transporter permease [Alphaproteobacteria bacterium]|nr:MAG: sugar ABC transporter permease [Alphaproteobacteria bacterium]
MSKTKVFFLFSAVMRLVEFPFRLFLKCFGMRNVAWFFLAPNLIFFGIFSLLPVILNIAYSLTGGSEILLNDRTYIGADNFSDLLQCEDYMDPNSCKEDLFWRSLSNTTIFVFLQVGMMVGFALITALILNRKIVARGFFRSVFFFPVMLSPVVVALIWKWILQRNGLLNAGIEYFGYEKILWLLERNWAFFWSVFVSVWMHMGFYALIILAGLQAIPKDVYEAARMDAARPFVIFRRITLPLLMPTMTVVMLLALIKGVQTFDEVYALTGGGPGTTTTFIIQYIYETGFAGSPRLLGLAAAVSLLLACALIILTTIQFIVKKRSANG